MIKENTIELILNLIGEIYAGFGHGMDENVELAVDILSEACNISSDRVNYFIKEYVYKVLDSQWVMDLLYVKREYEIFQ